MRNPISESWLGDNMEYMAKFPDKFFELGIVDPPYEISSNPSRHGGTGAGKLKSRILNKSAKKFKSWDIKPGPEYFKELFRVTKNQIIWGGNYFALPSNRCFIVWDKEQPFENFSACEYAWTSFDMPSKIFHEATTRTGEKKIHPTQKSVKLYKFCLHHFAKPGDKILDTHLGSQSSRIAAYKMGFDFYGCEGDEEYFNDGNKRVINETRETKLAL